MTHMLVGDGSCLYRHVLVPVTELTCDEPATSCKIATCVCTHYKDPAPFVSFVAKAASSIENRTDCLEKVGRSRVCAECGGARACRDSLGSVATTIDLVEEFERTFCLVFNDVCDTTCGEMSNHEARNMAELAQATFQTLAEGAELKHHISSRAAVGGEYFWMASCGNMVLI